jgi:hypothetical protein
LQQLHDTVQTIVPRFFRGQVLVTLWAIFQGTTNEIAEYIRINKNLDKKWRRARGDNDLCKLRTYFAEDLEFPLFVDREIEERLDMLLVLRNVLAHANGRMDGESCDPARRVRIEQYQNQGVGISRYPEALIFSEEFIRLMCASVGDYCRDLMKRVRASY